MKAEDESFHRRRRVCKNMDVIKPLPVNWSEVRKLQGPPTRMLPPCFYCLTVRQTEDAGIVLVWTLVGSDIG